MPDLTIGEAAHQSGVGVTTIRFYEERGLMPAPPRSAGGRRLYDPGAVRRLAFIRHARDLGFPLEAVADLLALQDHPDHGCDEAHAIAGRQLAVVEGRIARLMALRDELRRMTRGCDGDSLATCRVIESVADHAQCTQDHKPAAAQFSASLGAD